jgi:hypothetical protein
VFDPLKGDQHSYDEVVLFQECQVRFVYSEYDIPGHSCLHCHFIKEGITQAAREMGQRDYTLAFVLPTFVFCK